MMRSQIPQTRRHALAVGIGRRAVVAVALGLVTTVPSWAQTIAGGAPATRGDSATIAIGGLRLVPAPGAWVRTAGSEELACRDPACAGAVMAVSFVDAPCGDALLLGRVAGSGPALRLPPSDVAGQGLTFRVAIVPSPCRSLSGDTLVACTTVGGRTRLVEVFASRDRRCALPTTAAAAAQALLATARPDTP